MLNGAGDSHGYIQGWANCSAGLANLMVLIDETTVDSSSAGANLAMMGDATSVYGGNMAQEIAAIAHRLKAILSQMEQNQKEQNGPRKNTTENGSPQHFCQMKELSNLVERVLSIMFRIYISQ